MSKWIEVPFLDLFSSVIDNRGKTPPLVNSGRHLLEIKHIRGGSIYPSFKDTKFVNDETWDNWFRGHVRSGDILFSTVGTIAETALVPREPPLAIAQNLLGFRVDEEIADNRFIFYLMRSAPFLTQISARTIETVQKSIKIADMRTCSVRLPPLAEQKVISGVLSALDDKIELNRRVNETLEAMARAIFKDWFVDFGPTRAKAEGRAPYLTPDLWDLFPDALDDEDKPSGWQVRTLEDFLELAYGKSLPAKKRTPGNVAVYGSGGLTGTHDTALIQGPAVIIGRKGTVGSLYWEDGPAFPIDTVFYVVPRIGSMLFNYHLIAFQPLSDMNTDAAVPGLNRSNAYRLEFPLPEPALVSAFDDIAGPLWRRRTKNLKETETLVQTRDLLLPKLMSGEIRLAEAEKAVEAVA